MARPRTPTKILQLRGAGKKHPERMRARENEMEPEAGIGPAPYHFTTAEREAWDEIVRMVPAGVLGNTDRIAVERAAKLLVRSRVADGTWTASDERSLITYLSKFGLTPADRSRVSTPKKGKKDAWDDL